MSKTEYTHLTYQEAWEVARPVFAEFDELFDRASGAASVPYTQEEFELSVRELFAVGGIKLAAISGIPELQDAVGAATARIHAHVMRTGSMMARLRMFLKFGVYYRRLTREIGDGGLEQWAANRLAGVDMECTFLAVPKDSPFFLLAERA